MKIILAIFFLNLLGSFALQTQENNFYLDAIVFKSDSTGKQGRVDVMALVPYSSLKFKKESSHFVANLNLDISIWGSESQDDKDNNKQSKLESVHISKKVIAKDYLQSKGDRADFVRVFKSFHLSSGKYKVTVKFSSKVNSKGYEKSKKILVPEFSKFNFSLSGLMLLSSIEEKADGYKITPFAKDNIQAIINDGFFVFFETYSGDNSSDGIVSLKYLIKNHKGDTLKIGNAKSTEINRSTQQHFLLISDAASLDIGSYTLQVVANSQDGKTIAMSERSIKNAPNILTKSLEDIDKAISQLRYVTSTAELNRIEDAKSDKEKRRRFFAFWDELDPTPSTVKNEAMEEYYARIQYANEKFGNGENGWNSDRGRIFIILGPPESSSESNFSSSSGARQVWIYSDNRRFVFLDRYGFGDYRLGEPFGFSEKYKYRSL